MQKNTKTKRKAIALLTAVTVVASGILPVCADSSASIVEPDAPFSNQIITPYDMDVSSGSYTGTQYSDTFSLKKANGQYVNFWISNKCEVPIKITINGGKARTIASGEQGHIYENVPVLSKKFTFKAVSGGNGGT